jgi:hypothetical protein
MHASELIETKGSASQVEAIARVALDQMDPRRSFSRYLDALTHAVSVSQPPYDTSAYRDLYEGAASDPTWMVISLIANSEREGDGSRRLWSLSACSPNAEHQALLKRHSIDESRHSLAYLTLIDLCFPGMVEDSFRAELQQLSPKFSSASPLRPVEGSPYAKAATIDDYIQMNIAEIRTTIHHLMMRRALPKYARFQEAPQIGSILDALLNDELSHVAYTGALIEELSDISPDLDLAELFRQRFVHFNRITEEELGDFKFDCSVDCCEKRPSCRSKTSPNTFVTTII